jgi:hypothetical protein
MDCLCRLFSRRPSSVESGLVANPNHRALISLREQLDNIKTAVKRRAHARKYSATIWMERRVNQDENWRPSSMSVRAMCV